MYVPAVAISLLSRLNLSIAKTGKPFDYVSLYHLFKRGLVGPMFIMLFTADSNF
jgi:hypothetical protein